MTKWIEDALNSDERKDMEFGIVGWQKWWSFSSDEKEVQHFAADFGDDQINILLREYDPQVAAKLLL